jgi:outer membrane protein TolC
MRRIEEMLSMKLLSALLATSLLTGCTVGPDYHKPDVALTAAYHAPATIAPAEAQWWKRFNDPVLDALVDQALAQNMDIAAAAARITQARGVARAAGAALLPTVGVGASAERDRTSLQTPFGAASRELGFPRDYSLYQMGAQASWEIDLFGGLRRGREAARADLAATQAHADAVRLSIAAETVDAYLQLRGLQARLAVAQGQLQTEKQLVDLVRQQSDQGWLPTCRSTVPWASSRGSRPPFRRCRPRLPGRSTGSRCWAGSRRAAGRRCWPLCKPSRSPPIRAAAFSLPN